MKKITFSLFLSSIFVSYATAKETTHNFYTVVNNNSHSTDIKINTKNDSYWDSWGWCDGLSNKSKNNGLLIEAGKTKTYCGNNKSTVAHTISDNPKIEHEWWFKNNNNWNLYYTEVWSTRVPISLLPEDKHSSNINIIHHKDSKNSKEFRASIQESVGNVNSVVFYNVGDNSIELECYNLTDKFDWKEPETMKQGKNYCQGYSINYLS